MVQKIHYPSEFRREAVKLAMTSEDSIASTARGLGLNPKKLYRWVNTAMNEKTNSQSSQKPNYRYQELEKENKKLKKDLKKTQQERDILKKAAAYFASQGV